MPKPATVFLGIAVVAGSLAFNIVRYPIVGRMLANEPLFAANAVSHKQEEPSQKAPATEAALMKATLTEADTPVALSPHVDPEQSSVIPLAEQPEEQAGLSEQPAPASQQTIGDESRAKEAALPELLAEKNRPINGDRPLVPVTMMPPTGQNRMPPKTGEVVRRLPPVENSSPVSPAALYRLPEGRWPTYPSTGLE